MGIVGCELEDESSRAPSSPSDATPAGPFDSLRALRAGRMTRLTIVVDIGSVRYLDDVDHEFFVYDLVENPVATLPNTIFVFTGELNTTNVSRIL